MFGRTLRLEGSPFTHLVYQREFGDDLHSAWGAIANGCIAEELAVPLLLQIIWAMCKTYDERNTQQFHRWLAEFGFDETDDAFSIPDEQELLRGAFELARDVVRAELAVTDRPKQQNDSDSSDDDEQHEDYECDDMARWVAWQNILNVIQIGFSYDDIKHMPIRDFIAYTDLLSESHEEPKSTSRKATQADWDWLMS